MKSGSRTLKKLVVAGVVAAFASLVVVPESEADRRGHRHQHHHRHRHHHHARFSVGFGPSVWWTPYPYWYYAPPPYAVYAPPPVVVQEPPVYIQQETAPPPAPPAAAEPQYWYYCESAKGYYPTVPSCAEAWVKVPPRP
jgi:hypothetical protein